MPAFYLNQVAYQAKRPFCSLKKFFIASLLLLATGQHLVAQPDLSVTVTADQSTLSNGEVVNWSFTWKNTGDETAIYPKLRLRFSVDSILSEDDAYVYNSSVGEILPGNTVDRSHFYFIPLANSFSGTAYLIAASDPDNKIDETNEGNNTGIFPIEIHIQQPPEECAFKIGPGEIHCFEKRNDAVAFYAKRDDGSIQEYEIGLTGGVTEIGDPFVMVSDSFFIQNGEVVKQSADGTIAWQKPVPAEVFDHLNDLDKATELDDGSIVFAGFQKVPEEAKSTLILIKSFPDLSIDRAVQVDSNFHAWIDTLSLPDTVVHLEQRPGGGLNVIYNKASPIYNNSFHSIFRVVEMPGFGSIPTNVYMNEEIEAVVKTPCNSYRFRTKGTTGGITSGVFWKGNMWVEADSGKLLNQFQDLTRYTDFGPFFVHYFLRATQEHPYPIRLTSPSIGDTNWPLGPMEYVLSSWGTPGDAFDLGFFPFLAVFRTQENDVMTFGKTRDSLFVHIPGLCPPIPFSDNLDVKLCPGSEWNGMAFYQDTSWVDTIIVAGELDTIRTVNIEILESHEEAFSIAICEGGNYVFGNETLTLGGTYVSVFENRFGCDSTVHLSLEVSASDSVFLEFDLCLGDSSPLTGTTPADPCIFFEEVTLTNQNGCDSVVVARLNVYPTYYAEVDSMVPYGGLYNGVPITQDIQLVFDFTSIRGCDSTLVANLTVGPNSINELDELVQIEVFPNPVRDGFFLYFNLKVAGVFDIEVVNVLGEKIATLETQRTFLAGAHQVFYPITDWPAGTAFIVVKNGQQALSRKLVKLD
ncbi:MAG: CARDB domain-containing protein [Bacteroidota bacterium]